MRGRTSERRPRPLPDELLEYYGDLFVTLGVAAAAGISFERFLVDPDYHLSRVAPPPPAPRRRWTVRLRRALLFLFLLLLLLSLAACASEPAGPEGVARAFVDRYYAAADPGAAAPYASGLARKKLEEEQRLAAETVADPRARERQVDATLEGQQAQGEDRMFFTFLVTVRVGPLSLRKRVLVATGKQGGAWSVTNYRETDL
ncbi:MAG: hypothetical protein ACREKK_06840 [Candidatus Methylomirabilales bacterium]